MFMKAWARGPSLCIFSKHAFLMMFIPDDAHLILKLRKGEKWEETKEGGREEGKERELIKKTKKKRRWRKRRREKEKATLTLKGK